MNQMSKSKTEPELATGAETAVAKWLPILGGICVVLTLLDWSYERHPHVRFEEWRNFYGFFAIIATLVCCLMAKLFGVVITRDEGYYDE